MAKGTIFKFHNDLDTDQIIASQYLLLPNLEEMKEHAFESLDPAYRLLLQSHLQEFSTETLSTSDFLLLSVRSCRMR